FATRDVSTRERPLGRNKAAPSSRPHTISHGETMKLQIAIDDQRYEVEVEIAEDDNVPRPSYVPPVSPATRLGSAYQPAAPATDAHTCRSPIAGLVIRVNVQPGQTIQPNDLLLV